MGLYVLSAALLLFRIGEHPWFTYNWENSTVYGLFAFRDSPTLDLFKLTQGLMTDSGESPLVILPAWLGFLLGGVSLAALRAPVALIAALAVPLAWSVGRRTVGPVPAAVGAVGQSPSNGFGPWVVCGVFAARGGGPAAFSSTSR